MGKLPIYVEKDYLHNFNHLIEDNEFDTCKLNLFALKICNNQFDYNLLIEDLVDRVVTFCTQSEMFIKYKEKNNIGKLSRDSRRLFKEYIAVKRSIENNTSLKESKDGELEELMLYSFAESHLGAPKILTKMRCKTSSNDAVKRSDGIHLVKLDEDYYEIAYGESKLYESLTEGLTKAFTSISDFITRDNNNINEEKAFLVSNISNEFNETEYNLLKRILIPSEEEIYLENSFIIFVGFEINIPSEIDILRGPKFKDALYKHVKENVEKRIKHIQKKIKEFKLERYNFYIYLVPFTELNKTKAEILKEILS